MKKKYFSKDTLAADIKLRTYQITVDELKSNFNSFNLMLFLQTEEYSTEAELLSNKTYNQFNSFI